MCACPDAELVERYIRGDCCEDERRNFAVHIKTCEDCRELLEATLSNIGSGLESYSARYSTDDDETQSIREGDRPTERAGDATIVSGGVPDYNKSIESMIDGYKIVETLPRGGQAVVYKAVHIATKTHVAIKVLLPTLLASERARYYFEREAELIASMDHPNIVSIRDSGIIHHQYYFVMQYIDGEPLRRYVQAERLLFRQKVELLNKICSAITYAHQQGIIHRDLKFANILVDKRGEPHILDFGLAKAVGMDEAADDKAVVTMTGQWAGSLSTMSPEQASGQPNMIDVRTDVYSLGVILYTLLTGQYPYDVGGPTLEALKNIQEAEPTRPRQIIPNFNSEMEAILLTALAKKRERRYQSAAELQSDIENWLEGRPIRVKSISTMYLLRKIISRHRYTSTVAALLAVIVIAFGLISFNLYKRGQRALNQAQGHAQESASLVAKVPTLVRRLTFTLFLQAWNSGDISNSRHIAARIVDTTKESKAAAFLLDKKPIEDKLAAFKKSVSNDNTGFASFIIGEHYHKDGNRLQALDAYKDSYETLKKLKQCGVSVDNWLDTSVRARLYELRAGIEPPNEAVSVEGGGPEE
ncbi:MAG: protein kinase [Sedimentisphaerales bacterium]|nr:protein kinase [Sedimentisphaerales bacterium]